MELAHLFVIMNICLISIAICLYFPYFCKPFPRKHKGARLCLVIAMLIVVLYQIICFVFWATSEVNVAWAPMTFRSGMSNSKAKAINILPFAFNLLFYLGMTFTFYSYWSGTDEEPDHGIIALTNTMTTQVVQTGGMQTGGMQGGQTGGSF